MQPYSYSLARLSAAGYLLTAAALWLVLALHLLPAMFAELLVYALVNALASGMQRHLPGAHTRPAGGPLTVVLNARCTNLAIAFRDVVFAQTKISALNTLFTGIFLFIVLPLFGVHLHYAYLKRELAGARLI
jgi:hypothetical protein